MSCHYIVIPLSHKGVRELTLTGVKPKSAKIFSVLWPAGEMTVAWSHLGQSTDAAPCETCTYKHSQTDAGNLLVQCVPCLQDVCGGRLYKAKGCMAASGAWGSCYGQLAAWSHSGLHVTSSHHQNPCTVGAHILSCTVNGCRRFRTTAPCTCTQSCQRQGYRSCPTTQALMPPGSTCTQSVSVRTRV